MIAAMQKENFKKEKGTEKFSIISNRINDYRLKPRNYAVYCCLVKHSDKNGVCFQSRRLIAAECCIDKKTVDAAIRNLEKAGLVIKRKHRRQGGTKISRRKPRGCAASPRRLTADGNADRWGLCAIF